MKAPKFTIIYPTILHVKIDTTADGVLYAKGEIEPDELNILRHFPENGYDICLKGIRGLGRLPQ